jgi:hypothetical protein
MNYSPSVSWHAFFPPDCSYLRDSPIFVTHSLSFLHITQQQANSLVFTVEEDAKEIAKSLVDIELHLVRSSVGQEIIRRDSVRHNSVQCFEGNLGRTGGESDSASKSAQDLTLGALGGNGSRVAIHEVWVDNFNRSRGGTELVGSNSKGEDNGGELHDCR